MEAREDEGRRQGWAVWQFGDQIGGRGGHGDEEAEGQGEWPKKPLGSESDEELFSKSTPKSSF